MSIQNPYQPVPAPAFGPVVHRLVGHPQNLASTRYPSLSASKPSARSRKSPKRWYFDISFNVSTSSIFKGWFKRWRFCILAASEGFDRSFILTLTNAFLIRHPAKVLASYTQKWTDVDLRAIGFIEQAKIFDQVAQKLGHAPAVIDADDVLADPRGVLTKLCAACGIAFSESMLHWPKGPKPFDGVWASHWYNAAWNSEGFAAAPAKPAILPTALQHIADAALPYYDVLRPHRITSAK